MRTPRFIHSLAAAGTFALGACVSGPVASGPAPVRPMALTIVRPEYDKVLVQTNRYAYVALFEILPDRGVSIVYPATEHQAAEPMAGQYWIPVSLQRNQPVYRGFPPRRVVRDHYLYAIASDVPFHISDADYDPQTLASELGDEAYRGRNVAATMRALAREFGPALPAQDWAEDSYALEEAQETPVVRVYCGDGEAIEVRETIIARVNCSSRPPAVYGSTGGPSGRTSGGYVPPRSGPAPVASDPAPAPTPRPRSGPELRFPSRDSVTQAGTTHGDSIRRPPVLRFPGGTQTSGDDHSHHGGSDSAQVDDHHGHGNGQGSSNGNGNGNGNAGDDHHGNGSDNGRGNGGVPGNGGVNAGGHDDHGNHGNGDNGNHGNGNGGNGGNANAGDSSSGHGHGNGSDNGRGNGGVPGNGGVNAGGNGNNGDAHGNGQGNGQGNGSDNGRGNGGVPGNGGVNSGNGSSSNGNSNGNGSSNGNAGSSNGNGHGNGNGNSHGNSTPGIGDANPHPSSPTVNGGLPVRMPFGLRVPTRGGSQPATTRPAPTRQPAAAPAQQPASAPAQQPTTTDSAKPAPPRRMAPPPRKLQPDSSDKKPNH